MSDIVDLKEETDFVGEFATKSCASNLKEEPFKAVSPAKNGTINAVSTDKQWSAQGSIACKRKQ